MNITDTRRYEMLVRVGDFGVAHTDIFPADSVGGQMFKAVAEAAKALGHHAAAETQSRGAAGEALRTKVATRERLETALNVLRRTARALAIDTPGLDSKFRHPGSQGERAFVDSARAFSKDARTLATALFAHGLPPTFLDDLDATIIAFEAAIRDHATSRATLATARAGISAALETGLTAVQRLDAVVPNVLHGDSATCAGWERARQLGRLTRARKDGRKTSQQPAAPPAPPASGAEQPTPPTPVTPETA